MISKWWSVFACSIVYPWRDIAIEASNHCLPSRAGAEATFSFPDEQVKTRLSAEIHRSGPSEVLELDADVMEQPERDSEYGLCCSMLDYMLTFGAFWTLKVAFIQPECFNIR